MDLSKTLILIASLSSLLLLANAVPSTRSLHSNLLKLCDKTTNPTLCSDTILPHFQGGFDPFRALEIEVEATLNRTKKTAAVIAELLGKQDNSKETEGALQTCKEQYDSIVDSINETKDAIAKRNVIEAKFKFSAVLSFQATCKDEFKGSALPFAGDSDAIYQLGGNCLDLIANMEKDVAPEHEAPAESTPSEYSDVIGTVS